LNFFTPQPGARAALLDTNILAKENAFILLALRPRRVSRNSSAGRARHS
jgi:hypothetical protein